MSLKGSKVARDEAMDRIERNTNPEWQRFMYRIIVEVARRHAFFATDRVFARAFEHDNVPPVHDRRALGPIMKHAEKLGICRPTPKFELCRRRSRYAAPLRVWKSLIHAAI
jgi:hypothetical protein